MSTLRQQDPWLNADPHWWVLRGKQAIEPSNAEDAPLPDAFFIKHLTLDIDDATSLHQKYYKEYGLAIEGLTRFHKIDALQFNREVDDALPLDSILRPDPHLRQLLEDIDSSKVKLWLLTNAYITHAQRVVRLLGVDDLFEGITFCDYGASKLICKPHPEMFEKAEREAKAPSTDQCFFVGKLSLYSLATYSVFLFLLYPMSSYKRFRFCSASSLS